MPAAPEMPVGPSAPVQTKFTPDAETYFTPPKVQCSPGGSVTATTDWPAVHVPPQVPVPASALHSMAAAGGAPHAANTNVEMNNPLRMK